MNELFIFIRANREFGSLPAVFSQDLSQGAMGDVIFDPPADRLLHKPGAAHAVGALPARRTGA
jgi:hypothetical protein